jgi:hypothetical protein
MTPLERRLLVTLAHSVATLLLESGKDKNAQAILDAADQATATEADQAWRADIRRADITERYAAYLDGRAVTFRKVLSELEAIATPEQPVPQRLREQIDALITGNNSMARALRDGDVPHFDPEAAELLLRSITSQGA